MELNRVRPYSFTSMRQVLDLHLDQVQRYLTRHPFTEEQYHTRSVQFSWSKLSYFFVQTTFNWLVIVFLLLNYTKWIAQLSVIDLLFERTLSIKKIVLFNATFLILFILWEDTCLFSFWTMATYRNTKLEVLFRLRSKLDSELTMESRRQLIGYFVRTTYLSGICSKFIACGLLYFAYKLIMSACKLYIDKQIDLSQFVIGLYFSISINLYFLLVMYALFSLVTGLFLVLKIFRMKLSKCSGVVKLSASFNSRFMFRVFIKDYVYIHRLINQYNYTIKEYVFTLNYATKFAATLTIIYIAKQDHFTQFSYLFLSFYMSIYMYDLYLRFRLSYFSTKNIEIYKYVAYFAARNQCKSTSLEAFSFGDKMFVSKNLFFSTKIDLMVGLLSNGLMGFTLGRQYYITKTKVIEDFLLNTYMLMLMYKRIKL